MTLVTAGSLLLLAAAALGTLGFSGVNGVRQGKVIELDLAETDKAAAEAAVKSMCDKLLANTVIEGYRVDIL